MPSTVVREMGPIADVGQGDDDDLTARFLTHLRYDPFDARDGGRIEHAREVVDVAFWGRKADLEEREEGGDGHGGRILRRTGV